MVSQAQIAALAENAGLRPEYAPVASAIAMAESGGNPNSHNTNTLTGDNSYGLWQINMLGDLGPARRRQFGISSNEELFDPKVNARAMMVLSHNGLDWSPWSTYKTGAYKKFMVNLPSQTVIDQAKSFLSGLVDGAVDGAKAALSPLQQAEIAAVKAGEALSKTTTWVSNPSNWVRVAYVVGGGILIAAMIGKLVSGTPAGKAVTSAGKKAAATAMAA